MGVGLGLLAWGLGVCCLHFGGNGGGLSVWVSGGGFSAGVWGYADLRCLLIDFGLPLRGTGRSGPLYCGVFCSGDPFPSSILSPTTRRRTSPTQWTMRPAAVAGFGQWGRRIMVQLPLSADTILYWVYLWWQVMVKGWIWGHVVALG